MRIPVFWSTVNDILNYFIRLKLQRFLRYLRGTEANQPRPDPTCLDRHHSRIGPVQVGASLSRSIPVLPRKDRKKRCK